MLLPTKVRLILEVLRYVLPGPRHWEKTLRVCNVFHDWLTSLCFIHICNVFHEWLTSLCFIHICNVFRHWLTSLSFIHICSVFHDWLTSLCFIHICNVFRHWLTSLSFIHICNVFHDWLTALSLNSPIGLCSCLYGKNTFLRKEVQYEIVRHLLFPSSYTIMFNKLSIV